MTFVQNYLYLWMTTDILHLCVLLFFIQYTNIPLFFIISYLKLRMIQIDVNVIVHA